MFTVKLFGFADEDNPSQYKLVEAKEVSIVYNRKLGEDEIAKVFVVSLNDTVNEYEINKATSWNRAYIENANGKTTQVVGLE